MNTARHLRHLLAFAPFLLITACSSTEPNGMHHVRLSAAVASAGGNTAPGLLADLIVEGEDGSVSISSAQIVLSRLKLASETCPDDEEPPPVSASGDGDDDHDEENEENEENEGDDEKDENDDDDDCPPLKVGPVLIDLPLDGSSAVVLDAMVPAGTYSRLQARLHAVKPGDEGVADFLAAHPAFEGVSVRVAGVFTDADGAEHEFTFTSRINVVSNITFDPPVTVDAGTTNLTIDVDLASWFTGASGGVIDPTNEANQHAIEKNIRKSLRACPGDH
jgi:hypothetical protein